MTGRVPVSFVVFGGLIFTAGLATGVLAHQYFEASPSPSPRYGQYVPPVQPISPERLVNVLARELELTDLQRQEIEPLLTARRERLVLLRGRIESQFAEESLAANTEISAVLTPEQRRRFEQLTSNVVPVLEP